MSLAQAQAVGPIPYLPISLVKESIVRGKMITNASRKREAEKRLDYYNSDVQEHLDDLLKGQFQHPTRLRLQPEWTNIVKPIINAVSMVYKSPAKRTVMQGDKPAPDAVQENYRLMSGDQMDARLKHVNRMATLLGTVGTQAAWRNDRVELDVITPDVANVVQSPEDVTRAAAVIIEQAFPDSVVVEDATNPYASEKFFIVWTDAEHMVYNAQGRELPELANAEGINPYGIIPIAWARESEPQGRFWNECAYDLINAQDGLAVKLTSLNQLVKMQAFSLPVLKSSEKPESLTVDPSNFIYIPIGVGGKEQTGDFAFVSPDPKITELLDVIDKLVTRIAWSWGMSPEQFKLVGSPASGFALKMQNMRLLERREDDVDLYRAFEGDLFRVMRAVWNAHMPGKAIPEDATLSINFAEPRYEDDPAVEDARWQLHVSQGLRSKAEWMMALDADIANEAEAIERLKHNQEVNTAAESEEQRKRREALDNALAGGNGEKEADAALRMKSKKEKGMPDAGK